MQVVVELYFRENMSVNSHLRSDVVLFLGAGASAPLGKKMMGDFVTHLSTLPDIIAARTGSNLFQTIANKKRDPEFLLEELGGLESKAYLGNLRIDAAGGYPVSPFQSTAQAASSLRRFIERQLFLHYRPFDRSASITTKSHLLPAL